MSFLDKLTKAVSDTVDRGKKEVDEFMRVQKVKGEISEAERRIQEAANRIGDIKRAIGDRVVELLASGALAQPELEAMAGPIADFERHIEEQRTVIADKKLEIERIKAEGDARPASPPAGAPAPPAAASPEAAPVDMSAPPPPPGPIPPTPEPAAAQALRPCPSCGKPVAPGAEVCGGCGAQLG